MKLFRSTRFERNYAKAPHQVQRAFDKQSVLLLQNLQHLGYRGEVRIILLNLGREPYVIHAGDRIAQMIVARYEPVEWAEAGLANSRRRAGGFGSSGR